MIRLLVLLSCLYSLQLCGADTGVTYTFPSDACQHEQLSLPLKDGAKIYVSFDGVFGEPGCRRMSFDIPQSIFWYYKVCSKLLYYESPLCESSLTYQPYYSRNYWYSSDTRAMTGNGCPASNGYYHQDQGAIRCNHDITSFDLRVNKNYKKNDDNNGYDSWRQDDKIILREINEIPNHVNDTFMLEITSTLEYRADVIGGLSGGLVGFVVLVAIISRICICMRRRKQLTGRYFNIPKGKFDGMKNYFTLSEGFSTECSVAGILLCSCVLCRRHDRHKSQPEKGEITECCVVEPQTKWPTVDSLNKTDMKPLVTEK